MNPPKINLESTDNLIDNQGWDDYWDIQEKKGGSKLYGIIAEFYRKFIIRPTLNQFIHKHFPEKVKVLHAGCGSGQVDRDIRTHIKITGLDISKNALKIYEKENKGFCESLYGSIFSIPLANESMDGIYNLGVMEHFDENDIQKILTEFRRVLKPSGKVILFWPPEFGLSVIFFKMLKFLVRPIYGNDVKFHPDEICRIKSKKHAYEILEKADLPILEYYFGVSDLFTYSVIVAQKRVV